MTDHFEIHSTQTNTTGEGEDIFLWYWRLRAANGEIVASSEAYVSQSNCERGCYDLLGVVTGAIIELAITHDEPTITT